MVYLGGDSWLQKGERGATETEGGKAEEYVLIERFTGGDCCHLVSWEPSKEPHRMYHRMYRELGNHIYMIPLIRVPL